MWGSEITHLAAPPRLAELVMPLGESSTRTVAVAHLLEPALAMVDLRNLEELLAAVCTVSGEDDLGARSALQMSTARRRSAPRGSASCTEW